MPILTMISKEQLDFLKGVHWCREDVWSTKQVLCQRSKPESHFDRLGYYDCTEGLLMFHLHLSFSKLPNLILGVLLSPEFWRKFAFDSLFQWMQYEPTDGITELEGPDRLPSPTLCLMQSQPKASLTTVCPAATWKTWKSHGKSILDLRHLKLLLRDLTEFSKSIAYSYQYMSQ